jgi:hypothetical protein
MDGLIVDDFFSFHFCGKNRDHTFRSHCINSLFLDLASVRWFLILELLSMTFDITDELFARLFPSKTAVETDTARETHGRCIHQEFTD